MTDDAAIHRLRATAAEALARLDLTDLSDGCGPAQIDALCARARTPFGAAAAVCLWPRFVAQARDRLGAASPVRIATVVNFPGGTGTIPEVVAQTRAAISEGADEIDLVIPYRALLAGDAEAVDTMVAAVRHAAPATTLKTILETGILGEERSIAEASRRAIAAGADLLKTSTGKAPVNATLEAARTMLGTIRDSGRPVGFKAAGGIGSVATAGLYLDLARREMGQDWPTPDRFRFGASGLLDDILAVLGGAAPRPAGTGY